MATLHIYLNFQGNTEEAFNFYKSVFGGEFLMVQRFKDTPAADQVLASEQDKIMHIALPIGNGAIMMATDALESMGQKLTDGDRYSLSISTESEEEANKIFSGLAHGGRITMPLQKQFWGALFGMLTDQFGIQWMVNYDFKKPE